MSLSCSYFFSLLTELGVEFYTGVPDSLLKHFCAYVHNNVPERHHIITANEGNAIAVAAGYHLGTGSIPLVYMQNSGLGNAVNPLLSLCDPSVYSIPMLLLIGWRGEPATPDEPQHHKQGNVTPDLLEVMGVPHLILSEDDHQCERQLKAGFAQARERETPFVLLVRKGTFSPERSPAPRPTGTLMLREAALEIVLSQLGASDLVVTTTGKTSRELFEINERLGHGHESQFLCVGCMGHCSSIALGLAVAQPQRQVFCIDGDGSFIMHMGSISTIGKVQPGNFKHILINNYVHESVGGQETAADKLDFPQIAKASAYRCSRQVKQRAELPQVLRNFREQTGPALLEIVVKAGSRKSLGRPTVSPLEGKRSLMRRLRETESAEYATVVPF